MLKDLRLIQAYYLGSPLFFLIGIWWGFEVRVTFIPDPAARFAYYLVLSSLGLLTHFRPQTGPWVALGESTLNLLLIMAWILVPIYSLTETAMEGGPLGVPYTAQEVLINGGLAGLFFLVGFYKAQNTILRKFPWVGGQKKGSPWHS